MPEYRHTKDVPWYLEPYIMISMKYVEEFLAERLHTLRIRERYVNEQENMPAEARNEFYDATIWREFIDGNREHVKLLELSIRDGELYNHFDEEGNPVSTGCRYAKLPKHQEFTIDWISYHKDRADEAQEAIEEMTNLLAMCEPGNEEHDKVRIKLKSDIEAQKRFRRSHERKAFQHRQIEGKRSALVDQLNALQMTK